MLKVAGSEVILFLPPLPPDMLQYMRGYNYAYVDDLRTHFKAHGLVVHDYHDPTTQINSTSDCEFIDGMHGGDVLYARILLNMAQSEPLLRAVIDQQYMTKIASAYSGLAMIPNHNITQLPEIDFLCFECKKNVNPD